MPDFVSFFETTILGTVHFVKDWTLINMYRYSLKLVVLLEIAQNILF